MTSTEGAPNTPRAEVGSPHWKAAAEAIPFFGILDGLGSIGHTVWIFDCTADMADACRDADILIIDSAVSDGVPEFSLAAARRVMRSPNVLIHDRASFQLRPVVPAPPAGIGWAGVFEKARAATRQDGHWKLVLVQPDRRLLCLPCLSRESMTSEQLAQAHRLIPEGSVRNVAVIALTELECDPTEKAALPVAAHLRAAGNAIPFFGLLLNLASAGNPLWIFDGREDAVAAGCAQADLLFIDSVLADKLTTRTLEQAAKTMRSENIAVYDRTSRKIALIRHVGDTQDKLEFRD